MPRPKSRPNLSFSNLRIWNFMFSSEQLTEYLKVAKHLVTVSTDTEAFQSLVINDLPQKPFWHKGNLLTFLSHNNESKKTVNKFFPMFFVNNNNYKIAISVELSPKGFHLTLKKPI